MFRYYIKIALENFVRPSLNQDEEAFNILATKIGSKPSYLTSTFDSPSLWTTLGLLSSEVVSISNQFNFEMTKIQKKTKQMVSEGIEASNDPQFESIHSRLNNIKTTILSLVGTVQELVCESETNVNNQSTHNQRSNKTRQPVYSKSNSEDEDNSLLSSSESSDDSLGSSFKDERFNSLLRKTGRALLRTGPSRPESISPQRQESDTSRLDRMEADIRALKALKDGVAVKFCALGFKSRKDSDHWLKDHSSGPNFGLVVDVYAVFEHLYALIFGKESALSNLHSLARIKLQTDIEGIVV